MEKRIRFDIAHIGDTIILKFNGTSVLMTQEEALFVSEGLKDEAHLSITEDLYENSYRKNSISAS